MNTKFFSFLLTGLVLTLTSTVYADNDVDEDVLPTPPKPRDIDNDRSGIVEPMQNDNVDPNRLSTPPKPQDIENDDIVPPPMPPRNIDYTNIVPRTYPMWPDNRPPKQRPPNPLFLPIPGNPDPNGDPIPLNQRGIEENPDQNMLTPDQRAQENQGYDQPNQDPNQLPAPPTQTDRPLPAQIPNRMPGNEMQTEF